MKKLLLFFSKNPKKIWQINYIFLKIIFSFIFAFAVMLIAVPLILILIPFEMYNKKIGRLRGFFKRHSF
jgi:hypothetical protein